MSKKALCLSGGGARGSFQMGAIKCLYEVFGFRPDIIAAASVGAVNGIKLATEPPPLNNDSRSILTQVAAGNVDGQLRAMRELEQDWLGFLSATDFFVVRAPFKGTPIEDAVKAINSPTYSGPMNTTINPMLDQASVLISIPIINLVTGPVVAIELQKIRHLIEAIFTENSILDLEPIRARLFDSTRIDMAKLNSGTPLYLATVSLETGRLRYVTGKSEFLERDGATPVATALSDSDVDNALDENLQPLAADRKSRLKSLLGSYRASVSAIATSQREYNTWNTTELRRRQLAYVMIRERERGNYYASAIRNQLGSDLRGNRIRIDCTVDPRTGVLASATMPVYFDPPVIGVERYVDGGVREIIPVRVVMSQGAQEIVGIVCSANTLSDTGSMDKAGLASVAMRSLVEISLKEIVEGDLAEAASAGVPAHFIMPTFDVHDTVVVQGSLIEISMDYGWMRACDEMQSADETKRADFRITSDLLSRLRMMCLEKERYLAENNRLWDATGQVDDYYALRIMRWAIKQVADARVASGLPVHPAQHFWPTRWERELRGTGLQSGFSIWQSLSVMSGTEEDFNILPAVSLEQFAPDRGSIIDDGNDRVFWLVRGAIFLDSSGTTPAPGIVLPHGLQAYLPKIPQGTHLLAEVQDAATAWLVAAGKRYKLTAEQRNAGGFSNTDPALVPKGGLTQIPDGGMPYWLGGLVISDNQPTVIHEWSPTPQVEGTRTSTGVYLWNRSSRVVQVNDVRITTPEDAAAGAPVFKVNTPRPFSVPVSQVFSIDIAFAPTRQGRITGMVEVNCDDPIVSIVRIPLSTSAIPLGGHAELKLIPTSFDFGSRLVGTTVGQNLAITNTGTHDAIFESLAMTVEQPSGQFAIPAVGLPGILKPAQTDTVYVSYNPTTRGGAAATFAIDIRSDTDASPTIYRKQYQVPLTGAASMPTIFLAGQELPPSLNRPGGIGRPLPRPLPLNVELQVLDFGSVPPNTNATASFWIRNIGDAPLTARGVVVVGQSQFGIVDSTIFPATLSAGSQLRVASLFLAAPVPGMRSTGEFRILSDDPQRPEAILRVLGQAAGPHLAEPSELLDFGVVSATVSTTITFRSDGSEAVSLRAIALATGTDFAVSGAPAIPAQLVPGTDLKLTVTLTSTQSGSHQDQLILTHDGKPSHLSQIQLRAFVT
jgi:predicted acylesterase/phospholipase RssA